MKNAKKIIAFLMALTLLVSTIQMPVMAATTKKATIKTVSIVKPETKTLVLKAKKSYQLKTKVTVNGKISKKVTYKSSNEKVATVSKNGKIKALKKGKTTITVRSKVNKKKKTTLKVIVGTPVKSVKLNKSKVKTQVGKKVKLKATVSPKKSSVKGVKFTSSNKKVATVSKKGVVTCKKAGKVTITATAKDGSAKKAKCTITIKKKKTEPSNKPVTPNKPGTPNKPVTPNKPDDKDDQDNKGDEDNKLSYDGYNLKWEDDFDGDALNEDDWNYEEHAPGWVNSELQAYVKSDQNVYVKDGKLVIQPVKTKNEDGSYSITSGRINTQGKHDFTYGLFEVRAKVPSGKGFLPAFWMMPTDENLYGQWPRCGEIDAMEVMGQETDKVYGTIHYGSPHAEKQGTYTLENGNFADEYHTFSCDWQPGKITWYVDGIKYHETSDWFTAVEGETEVAYPAPFDQPFYMILNLAVGGSWVGYPDDDADYINTQSYSIDYVKVYQKDSYNEDVEKPVNEVIIRDPDANGNYVNNGDFAKTEDLTDDIDWKFLTTLEGEGNAVIKNKAIEIHTDKAGTVDYSIQLVQPSIPAEKGGEYTVTFDAWADEARTMKVDVSAPDRSYKRYLNDTVVDLTTEKQTYTYTYTMTDKPDANARLEFNFGATDSTATVYITNVSIKKTAQKEIDNSKKPLSDGNYIYNGGFQEGKNRLGDWTVTNNCQAVVSVTGLADGRRLMVKADTKNKADVILSQDGLPLNVETEYALSFDAQADTDMQLDVVIAGETFTADVTTDKQTFNYVFKTPEELTDAFKTITYFLGNKGTIYLDNVRVVENTLIKNGSFKAGFSGYEVYAEGSTDVSYVVDSQTEDCAADFTIKDTGAQDWMIQLKQNNISLEEGQWYRLSLKAKSDMNRKLMVALQRDGSSDDDWTPYSGSKTVDLTDEYQSIVVEFKMKNKSDPRTILSISMGAVGGVQIKQQHRICIDDIILEKIDAPKVDETESDVNLIKNADFSEGDNGLSNWEGGIMGDAVGTQTVDKGVITYELSDVGTADWNVQLKQTGLALENGKTYEASITLKSTEARTVLLNFMSNTYKWYGGETIVLPKNEEVVKTITFTMNEETDTDAGFFLSMGKIADVDTPASTITVSNISLKKLAE